MLIAGAGGHAVELTNVLEKNGYSETIHLWDDINTYPVNLVLGKYSIISSIEEAARIFKNDNRFALGVGKPLARKLLAEKLEKVGGRLISIVSIGSSIGHIQVNLAEGLNIMQGVVITERIKIGKGTLVHIHSSIHHDVEIGEYCELSPGCRILGAAKIGSLVSIGANATILPGVRVGDAAVIGAGAVVTKDVESNKVVAGVPAVIINS